MAWSILTRDFLIDVINLGGRDKHRICDNIKGGATIQNDSTSFVKSFVILRFVDNFPNNGPLSDKPLSYRSIPLNVFRLNVVLF